MDNSIKTWFRLDASLVPYPLMVVFINKVGLSWAPSTFTIALIVFGLPLLFVITGSVWVLSAAANQVGGWPKLSLWLWLGVPVTLFIGHALVLFAWFRYDMSRINVMPIG